ncbi:MAG: hypothetical protein H0X44_01650 [Acidobacteria bacterium]|nr:hypothetical protein [Acidobacteriota bacterium]
MQTRWMAAALLLVPGALGAEVQADRALLAEIRQIRAIDNHSHIPPFAAPPEMTAARDPLGVAEFPYPVRLRVDSPEWPGVWRALYGAPVSDPHDVLRRKETLIREQGESHIAWMDRVAIDVALALAHQEFDRVVYPELAARYRDYAPRVEFVMFEKSRHFTFIEEPETTFDLLRAFLSK